MKETTFDNLAIQAIGATTPSILARAMQAPVRVLVRNTGVGALFVSQSTENLVNPGGPSAGSYRIPAGAEDVFVLATGQALYGVATGLGNTSSVTVSEAMPIDVQS